MRASLVSQWDGFGRCWSTPPALRIREFAAHCRRIDKVASTPLSGLCCLELVPPASSDGSSGVSDDSLSFLFWGLSSVIGTITALWGGVMIRMPVMFYILGWASVSQWTVLRRIPWTWDLSRSVTVVFPDYICITINGV